MGGYFLSNDNDAKQKAIEVFAKKGLGNYSVLKAGNFECVYFHKLNAEICDINNNYYLNGDDFIVGTGIYVYKDLIGTSALEKIYKDFKILSDKNIFNNVKGHFNFVIYKNGSLFLITDKTGTYHTYYGKNKNNIYISTSFLSVCDNMEKLTVQKQELLEYINTSVWQGNTSIFKEVNKFQSGNLISFDNHSKISYHSYYKLTFTGKSEPLNVVIEHIRNYFSFLKKLDLNILCDLSGGADSRLMLAVINAERVKYKCYTAEVYDDLELAQNIANGENISLNITYKNDNRHSENTFQEEWEKTFYFFDMTRPMFAGASAGEMEQFNLKIDKKNLLRFSGHAAELTRQYDWIYEKPTLYDFIKGPQIQMIMPEFCKRKFISNIIKKLHDEVIFDNENALTYKDINKIYFLLRCRSWAGTRITTSNQANYHFYPFEDLNLSAIFFNQDENLIRHNVLIKQLLNELYPGIGKYPSSYSYSFEDMNDKAELKYIGKPQKTFKDKIKAKMKYTEDFAWGGVKRTLRYNELLRHSPDNEPYIINKEFTEKIFGKRNLIIKSIIKNLNVTIQNDYVKDGIFSAEYLFRKYESKLKY